jgi:hypothetical protein
MNDLALKLSGGKFGAISLFIVHFSFVIAGDASFHNDK